MIQQPDPTHDLDHVRRRHPDAIIGHAEPCPQLCATGGTVIWTRARGVPDREPLICRWFEQQGFQRRWLSAPDAGFGVGVHQFAGPTQPLVTGERMFTFAGYDALRQSGSA